MGKRRNFYLSDLQLKRLNSMSKKMGLSASEILRRAIDEYWERYEKREKQLKELIRQKGLTIVDEPIFARYNPPFMPWFLRRNEVLIPVGQVD